MKPTLNEQLARMQKLAGIIKENQGSNTNMLDFSSWKRIMGDDNIYHMVPPNKNADETLDIWVYPAKNKVMIASNDDIMIQTIADKYNSEVYQEMAPSIYQVNLKLTDLATLFPGQDFFLDDMNEGKSEDYYKDAEKDDAAHIKALEKDMKDDAKKTSEGKMTKSDLKSKIKEMILAELNEDSTEDVNEPGALNNMYDPLAEIEAEEDEYEAEDDSSAESLYKMFVKYDLDNDRRYYDAEDFMMAYPNLSKEEAEKLEDMLQNPLDEANSNKVMLNGKEVDVNSIEVEGGSYNDYSDVYISFAKFKDGTDLNNDEREELENLVDMGELANDSLSEAKKDKEEVEDITVDDTEVVDAPESDMMAGESAEVSGIQANLQAAYAEAKALGDEKLITQIANTITYFTKAHILDTAPINENMFPMLKRILR
jgi:ribosomal protein S20